MLSDPRIVDMTSLRPQEPRQCHKEGEGYKCSPEPAKGLESNTSVKDKGGPEK